MTALTCLSKATLEAINTLGHWLADNDSGVPPAQQEADLIVLAGNAVLPTIEFAYDFAKQSGRPLLISGGIGHSTHYLQALISRHSRYHSLMVNGLSEAAILKDIAVKFWAIPAEQIIAETASANCGQNAQFTRAKLDRLNLAPLNVLLIQDPTMQRRTRATFARVWQDAQVKPRWLSFSGMLPTLERQGDGIGFAGSPSGVWPLERYISLICGEIPRLRDDADGYGPNGRDFIVHVDIPDEVMAAWHLLQDDKRLTQILVGRALT